jgi:hypothetical protein
MITKEGNEARQGKARQGKAGQGKARQGKAGQGKARPDKGKRKADRFFFGSGIDKTKR